MESEVTVAEENDPTPGDGPALTGAPPTDALPTGALPTGAAPVAQWQRDEARLIDERGRARRSRLILVDVLTFLASGLCVLAALWWGFRAYFALAGSTVDPTPEELTFLNVFCALAVLSALASVVIALILRGRWAALFGSLSAVGLIFCIVFAALLTSPQRPTTPPDPSTELPSNYQPCYSGSNRCN